MDHKMEFCYDDCTFLSITEKEQNKMGRHKPPHLCTKYNKQVKHGAFHPKLMKLNECDMWWKVKADVKWEIEKAKNMTPKEFGDQYCVVFKEDDRIDPKKSILLNTCKENHKNFIMGIDLASKNSDDVSVISYAETDKNGTVTLIDEEIWRHKKSKFKF
jgi:hypothetical protein